ncbi:MAG: transporter substrate-binding domain-containing protein [Bacteroidota bacterium]
MLAVIIFSLTLAGCSTGTEDKTSTNTADTSLVENNIQANRTADPIDRDFDQIKKDGVLRAITIFSPTSYFLYKGEPMGFEYELLTLLAEHLNLELEMVIADNMNVFNLLNMLNNGEGDLVAYGMTITEPRKNHVAFTHRYFESRQVLVQRKPENWRKMKLHEIEKTLITNPLDLIGKEVHVRTNSSYYQRLLNLQEEMGGDIIIKPVEGDIPTDEIIKMVVDKEIDFTVADKNIAAINETYYHILDVNTAISFPQRIAWAVRKNSPLFLHEVNRWIDHMKTHTDYYVIYNKYFKNKKLYREHLKSEFFSETGESISEFDDLIKKYADKIHWDWRLLSSLVYQESQFNPKAASWAGGKGLMQLMPSTAKELGVKNRVNPDQNIQGGTKYLQQIYEKWDDIPDAVQRIKFTLASYNCGYQHVRDAQRLSGKYQVETIIWDQQVEEYLLKLSKPVHYQDELVKYGYVRGEEPYKYVREIFDRYDHYKQFIPHK